MVSTRDWGIGSVVESTCTTPWIWSQLPPTFVFLFKFQSEHTELEGTNTIQQSDDSVLRRSPSHKLPTPPNVPSSPCFIRLHRYSVVSCSTNLLKVYLLHTTDSLSLSPSLLVSHSVCRSSPFSQKTNVLSFSERRDAVSKEDICHLLAGDGSRRKDGNSYTVMLLGHQN